MISNLLVLPLLLVGLISFPFEVTAQSGCGPLNKIQKEIEFEWADDLFANETQIEKFWEIHQRFGFVKDGNRMLLVAKDRRLAEQVILDLKEGFNAPESFEEVAFSRIPGGVKFDVTEMIPPLVKYLHGEFMEYDGPNCWNFCLRGPVSRGSIEMIDKEFNHWMSSPLAEKIEKYEDLKPLDIIVFRRRIPDGAKDYKKEMHGAVYVSDRVAVAKSRYQRTYPHRILDLREAMSLYYPGRSDYIEVFRMSSILRAAKMLPGKNNSSELTELIRKAQKTEQKADLVFFGKDKYGQESEWNDVKATREIFTQLGEELKAVARPHVDRLMKKSKLKKNEKIELALWQGLLFKADNYENIEYTDW